MKPVFRITMILCFFIAMVACKSNSSTKATSTKEIISKGPAQIRFDTDMHDFGDVFDGEKVSFSFKFTNTGNGPLVITGVATSCGCTVGEYTHDTIKSGKQGDVTVSFDSWKRVGFQQKSVTVSSNTNPPSQILRIKAMVLPANLKDK